MKLRNVHFLNKSQSNLYAMGRIFAFLPHRVVLKIKDKVRTYIRQCFESGRASFQRTVVSFI